MLVPAVIRIIKSPDGPVALTDDNRLVPVVELWAGGKRTTCLERAHSAVAGPVQPTSPLDPIAGKWLAFAIPDPVTIH